MRIIQTLYSDRKDATILNIERFPFLEQYGSDRFS